VVALDAQSLAREQLDEVLVAATRAAEESETARERPLEAVPPDRQVRAEPSVDEVAAVAVVKPVALHGDLPRPPEEREAVRPFDRAIAAMRERAAADPDGTASPRRHRRGEIGSLRGDVEVRQVDVLGVVDLDDRMLCSR
jgi:hypothetical protein